MELAFAPATELAAMVRRREVSPVELVDLFLERIDRIDQRLNSFVTLDPDGARKHAEEAEAALGDGDLPPFHGVPIGIKDLHLTQGMRTTFGTRAFADFVPDVDEENVARLRRAGFVFLGKTNAPELGTLPCSESEVLGPCRNPWDLERTPGGSSGGAAAAVAAGLVPVAHASDGGGSIRIPASNCGLFGLKPSRGRVSAAPLFGELSGGLGTTGPISRYVIDAAGVLDAMRGYHPGDPYWLPDPERPYVDDARRDPSRLRVGLVTSSPFGSLQPVTVAAAESTARLLEQLGHVVEPVELPFDPEQFARRFQLVFATSMAATPVDPAGLEPYNRELHRSGHEASAVDYLRARTSLHLQARALVQGTAAYDVVLSPTLAEPPLRIGELAAITSAAEVFERLARYLCFTPLANVTGQPSMSLPMGWTDDDLPVGVMATGRPGDEATLFQLAGQVERASGWTSRRPPIS